MSSGISAAKRVPATLPFVMRTSKVKVAGTLLVVGVIVESVLAAVVAIDDPAEELGFWGKQVVLFALLLLCWLVLAFRRTFGFDGTGVWMQVAGQAKTYAVFVPWSQISRVEPVRLQWQTSLGLSLRDPYLLKSEFLQATLPRRATIAIDAAIAEARKAYPPCDLQFSLTTANRSTAEVAQALSQYAPAEVRWHLDVDPAGLSIRSRVARSIGRVLLGIVWIGLFLAGTSGLVWAMFDIGPDSNAGRIVGLVSASVGGATLSWAYRTYERLLARGVPASTTDDRPAS